jgi:hypothetical protein
MLTFWGCYRRMLISLAIWLKFWSDDNAKGNDRSGYYLGVYAALQITGVIWFAVLIWCFVNTLVLIAEF